jgi:hypothetical protein
MTKEQRKNIKRLIKLREKAGERLMKYDGELTEEFEKLNVDFGAIEGGHNSIFLITEPAYCKSAALDVLRELEKGGAE